MQGEILLFPIQHGITIEEIRDNSPPLAGLSLWNSSDHSPAQIATEIARQLEAATRIPPEAPAAPTNEPYERSVEPSGARAFGTFYIAPTGTGQLPPNVEPEAPFFEPNGPHRMDSRGGEQRGTRICHRGKDPTGPVELGEQLGRRGILSSQNAFRRGTLRSDHTTNQRTTGLPPHRYQQIASDLPPSTEQQVRLDDLSDSVVQNDECNLSTHIPEEIAMSISPPHGPIHEEIEFWWDPNEKALLYEINLKRETGEAIPDHKRSTEKGHRVDDLRGEHRPVHYQPH